MIKLFEEVPEWDEVCPHLLNDKNGDKTRAIELGNPTLAKRRNEMLRIYIKNATPPTWNDIINALQKGNQGGLADRIKKDLQGN